MPRHAADWLEPVSRWCTGPVDIQQIRYFLAVADELHFGRAAEHLHVTPSSFSRRIRDLEQELGSDLFIREYHHVELTRFGQAFLEPARAVVDGFDDLKRLSRDPDAYSRRRCRIGATPLAAPPALDAVLDAFQQVAPDAELPIVLAPTAELLVKLAHGGVDLAVVHLPTGAPDMETITLGRGDFAIAMRADDPLAGRTRLTPPDLADRQLLLTSAKIHPPFMNAIRRALTDAGISRLIELPHNDAVQVATYVQRTGALAVSVAGRRHPSSRIYSEPDFTLVPFDAPGMEMRVGVAWRAGAENTVAALPEVLDALREKYGTTPMSL